MSAIEVQTQKISSWRSRRVNALFGRLLTARHHQARLRRNNGASYRDNWSIAERTQVPPTPIHKAAAFPPVLDRTAELLTPNTLSLAEGEPRGFTDPSSASQAKEARLWPGL